MALLGSYPDFRLFGHFSWERRRHDCRYNSCAVRISHDSRKRGTNLAAVFERLDSSTLLRFDRYLSSVCRALDKAGPIPFVVLVLFCGFVAVILLSVKNPSVGSILLPLSPPYLAYRVVPMLYRQNLETLSRREDLRAVAPLLDAVAFKLRREHEDAVRYGDRWVERLALRHLPALLNRMTAGDGPALTGVQADTLRWLVDRPDYYRFFLQPGLNDKIESVLDARRRSPSGAHRPSPYVY